MSHIQTVRDLIAGWEGRNVDAIVATMTPDCRYLNVGLPEAVGHAAIRGVIEPFLAGAARVQWTVHHIAETDRGAVLTERTDAFEMGGRELVIPVMGVFEFRDGKISAWRDYFDVPGFQRQMAGG